jgi:Metallo-peptidase family M12/Reprolysin family propeptide/FG-GAP repeat
MTKSFLFVILLISALFFNASAQTDALRSDLEISFKKVNVVRLDTNDALRQTGASQTLSIPTSNKIFELALTPNDLRSARYAAMDTDSTGIHSLEKQPISLFKGQVFGETNSQVRLMIDGANVEGYFTSDGKRYFVEPASRYSKLAKNGETIVYLAEDVLRDKGFDCKSDLAEQIEDGKKLVNSQISQAVTTLRVIEIATEADFEFVNSNSGSASAANAKILSILNMVDGVYQNELGLTVRVSFQHTWSTADSYDGTSINTLLNSFVSYWNTNFPAAQYPRDTAHLFSYKPNVWAQGLAYIGTVCNNPSFAYGVSGRVNTAWGWEAANFLITTHEIAHNLGASHSDSAANCANTLMAAQLSGNTTFTFCSYSRTEVGNFVAANNSCLAQQVVARTPFDFDGDNKTDIGIFRPNTGEWWLNRSSSGQTVAFQFGNSADKLVPGDFTGDGKADVALWRPSNGYWYILRSEDNSFFSFPFGTSGDVPVVGDFDADGKADAGVFRPSTSTWYVSKSAGGTLIQQFGTSGDVPVVADYDGDGKADVAIYRPGSGQWWISRSASSVIATTFGNSTDKPVQADYTGDGKADIAIFRPSNGNWYILRSEDNSFFSFPFGTNGDIPVAGDYDGDGKTDAGVFRPSGSTWYLQRSTAGTQIVTFGISGDKPTPNVFVP